MSQEKIFSLEDIQKYLFTLKTSYELELEQGNIEGAKAYRIAAGIFVDFFKHQLELEAIDWTKWKD
jgi:hypothetical protein